jgi:hypothetical protein
MSYPSVVAVLAEKRINLDTANDVELEAALKEAFGRDLGVGMSYLRRVADTVKQTGQRFLEAKDPNSAVGKQLIRLLGTDIARGIVERNLNVAFGLYNCCGVVAAPTREKLSMTLREQVMLQNGVLASADC